MKKVFLYFSFSFSISFCLLYLISGGIFSETESPPIEILESKEKEKILWEPEISKHKIPISSQHKILGGRYYSYDEKTSLVNYEVCFQEMLPLDSDYVLLKDIECIHYNREEKISYKNTPRRFIIRSEEGKLCIEKNAKKIKSLYLEKEVEIEGYENLEANQDPEVKEEFLFFVKTTHLDIDFQSKVLKTQKPVWLRWKNLQGKEIFSLEALGMIANTLNQEILFLSQVKTQILTKILEEKNKNNLAIKQIQSFSEGKTRLKYSKKTILLEQEKKVRITANQAKLLCDKIFFELKRKEDTKFQIQKIEAIGNVDFEDKNAARIQCGYFLWNDLGFEKSHLILKENPEINLLNIDAFSILDDKSKEKLQKEAKRHRLKTFYARCKDRIEIFQKKSLSQKGSVEEYFLYDDVFLRETSEKIPLLEIQAQKAEFIMKIEEGESKRRFPEFFKAYKNVIINHNKGKAKGEFFEWHSLSRIKSKIRLEGNPFLFLKNIASQKNKISASFSSINSDKANADLAKRSEDIQISSLNPMHLKILKEKKERSLSYKTENNIIVTRYTSDTNKILGKFYCQKLSLEMKPNKQSKKMEIFSLKAEKNLKWESQEVKGTSEELLYQDFHGENTLTLSRNVSIQTTDGNISARLLRYYTKREILEAFGSPVRLESKQFFARGQSLRYFRKQNCIEIQGNPAHVWQEKKEKNTISAPQITYWRNTEKISAIKGVELVFTTSGKDFAFLTGLEKSKKTQETFAKYLMKSKEIHAQIDTKQKSIRSLKTVGNVFIKKIQDDKNPQAIEAKGKELSYLNQKVTLCGERAEIFYDGNTIISPEFRFSTTKKEVLCQGPTKISISQKNTQFQGWESKSPTQPLVITTKGPVLYFQEKKEIHWEKDVLVKREEDTLKCQKMTVILESNKIASLIAYGEVEISSQNSVAMADQMRWNEKEEQAFLIAHPFVKIRSKDFLMKAPMVWYNIKERRFFTQGKDIQIESIQKE